MNAVARTDERGQALSSFIAVLTAGLVLVAGLVVDGGAHSAASARASQAAAEAARAGADAGAPARIAGAGADPVAIRAAAQDALTRRGIEGTVTVTAPVVRVETRTQVNTVFLSVIGITTLQATGSAEAELRTP